MRISTKYRGVTVSIVAVISGLLIGCLIMLLTGYNPLLALTSIVSATIGSPYALGEWITYSVPLILCGLSVGFAYKTGLFNIGAEGQFIVGSFVATFVGATFQMPNGLHVIVALLSGMLAGMLWGFIPGVLKAFFGVSEVVITIMLNWIAFFYINYLIKTYFHLESLISETPTIHASASLNVPFLTEMFGGSRINLGFLVVIIVAVVYWFILNKTTFGYEIKAVGYSPNAADYAGVKTKSKVIYTMVIAGAFAGLAGAVFALGSPGYLNLASGFKNYGFDGIVVAMLGNLSAIGIGFAGLLLGALRSGAAYMTGVPSQIIDIIIGTILVFSALAPLIRKKLFKDGDK
ncbi:MAG: ABC transporter permease [Mycoplasmatales bacterium]